MGTACSCACANHVCGCCDGVEPLTPAPIFNRAGLAAIDYRVGTQGQFLETMKARLSQIAPDGAVPPRPLARLTARGTDDFSIALLDGWASLGDVLSFYQERIANEGYLRTATERRSVLELANLVGYTLRPGVAASVHLAFTLDANQTDPVTIPAGARAQSLPGPGEAPQSFETAEDLVARLAWNNLAPRTEQPQAITLATVLTLDQVAIAGVTAGLRPGDTLLFAFADPVHKGALRKVFRADPAGDRTHVTLAGIDPALVATIGALAAFISAAAAHRGEKTSTGSAVQQADKLLEAALMDNSGDPTTWAQQISQYAESSLDSGVADALKTLDSAVKTALGIVAPDLVVADLGQIADQLLTPRIAQVASSARLGRNLVEAFHKGSDTAPQVLVNFAPTLRDSYYQAWANAQVSLDASPLEGLFVLRATAPLYGAGAGHQPIANAAGVFAPVAQWPEWSLAADESSSVAYLDQLYPGIVPPGYAVIQRFDTGVAQQQLRRVVRADAVQRSAYGLVGKTTRLTFDADWWDVEDKGGDGFGVIRSGLIMAGSEPLTLMPETIDDIVSGQTLAMAVLARELTSGRYVVVTGERADIPGTTGVIASELMVIAALTQGPSYPGDTAHTELTFATPLAFTYKRATVSVCANVVRATHGETRSELLGSGDGTAAWQSFTLKQPPLTFIPAPTAAGAASTLQVYVDDIAWHEVASLDALGPTDHGFVTATDDNDLVTITFGDGIQGARLPTGVQNIRAAYRAGIGAPGNVQAGQISLLQTRPLGVTGVLNPLRASGGADREDRDLARENTPLSIATLDRIVSVEDYADFARRFAGIGKAAASATTDGRRRVVQLTIAGVDDIAIDPTADLWNELLAALRDLGDPAMPVVLALRELNVLTVSARIKLLPDRLWEPVVGNVRAVLLDQFGFARRALGQPARLAEVIAAIQNVPGVSYVDVDAFGAIPEKITAQDGTRQLVTQDDIRNAVLAAAGVMTINQGDGNDIGYFQGPPAQKHTIYRGLADAFAWPGGYDGTTLRPAELAMFTPAVPDTIILNEVA